MISKTSFGMTSEGEEAFLYTLTSEKGMTIKVTNHSYFNLNGHESGNILEHQIWINSDAYVESDKDLIPTGRIIQPKMVLVSEIIFMLPIWPRLIF